jgi:hypothetical protein
MFNHAMQNGYYIQPAISTRAKIDPGAYPPSYQIAIRPDLDI